MRISIFGMGYVGAVCAACLAKRGNTIIGVDVSDDKVEMINNGKSPIVETGLGDLLSEGVREGRISATTNAKEAIANSDISFICVGTPSMKNGGLKLDFIQTVCREIAEAIAEKDEYHTIVVRSTVLPGTVNEFIRPIIEDYSGKKLGQGFGLAVNPEFLRESTAIKDYNQPPMTVIGAEDDISIELLTQLYSDLDAPLIVKPIEVAEMVKYSCNVWHATKVAFANEIGAIAKAAGVDGRDVMDIVCEDKSLNISKYYMKPGFAFGGSCLPKDVRALTYKANQMDVSVPLLDSIMNSNETHVKKAYDIVTSFQSRKIGLLGLSFKAGTDDLRESPLVELAEMLIGKGFDLKIFDENVKYASVHGANKEYINAKIPHVSNLLNDELEDVVDHADIIIIGNPDQKFKSIIPLNTSYAGNKRIVDLVGFMESASTESQHGICW
ncbi:nucleotide sugar dehydrogenase [Aestuariibacter sp. AA17]|uniref:GDP-mannose 6-dehydrogenase n=1 Tax=Fluctibacter corallii TaxID=2984329 RepID=A0ABT3A8B2_9ALTE|nr:nucleotide sugar dehydrogenase [Aestuariibacter sp. AA17]MCV2884913.1 nucleotide sugar dehydrogenase [Aestuariibacter sp. AA17]